MCAGTAATAAADASTCAETPKGWGSPGQVRVRLLLLMPCVCVCTCVHVCARVCVCVCVFVPLLKPPLLLCAACPLTVQAPLRTTLPCLPQTRLSSRTPFPTRLQPSWTRLATRLVDLSRPLSLPAALLTHTHTHIHTHTHSLSLTHSHKHTHTHTHTHTHKYTYSHTNKYTYTHARTHKQIHTLTHTHCRPTLNPLTLSPTAATTPEYSCPVIMGVGTLIWLQMWGGGRKDVVVLRLLLEETN